MGRALDPNTILQDFPKNAQSMALRKQWNSGVVSHALLDETDAAHVNRQTSHVVDIVWFNDADRFSVGLYQLFVDGVVIPVKD